MGQLEFIETFRSKGRARNKNDQDTDNEEGIRRVIEDSARRQGQL